MSEVKTVGKHTPGPWLIGHFCGQCKKPEHYLKHPGLKGDNPCVYEPIFFEGGGIVTESGIEIIREEDHSIIISPDDLCLISAAPDLLEACEMLVRHAEKLGRHSEVYDQARKAIAKARGIAK